MRVVGGRLKFGENTHRDQVRDARDGEECGWKSSEEIRGGAEAVLEIRGSC